MGYGDELQATGMARGAAARGKRIAFGNGKVIIWTQQSHEVFRGNPNIAPPGSERARDIEWIHHYRGCRLYGHTQGGRWIFRDFSCPPGEIFFTEQEVAFAVEKYRGPFIVIEPRVKPRGACDGQNKQWPVERYASVAERLMQITRVVQLVPPRERPLLADIPSITTPSFRHALAILSQASCYIGPEGGLHHGAAAVGIPAVVIWGGFNTPRSTGYSSHYNIAIDPPCGRINACDHCKKAMRSITVEQVLQPALRFVNKKEMADV